MENPYKQYELKNHPLSEIAQAAVNANESASAKFKANGGISEMAREAIQINQAEIAKIKAKRIL